MLTYSVKDFGPIIEGTVELKPLTVFIGPSNSGKSYFAELVYSLFQRLQVHPRAQRDLLGRLRAFPPGARPTAKTWKALQHWLWQAPARSTPTNKIRFSDLPDAVQAGLTRSVQDGLRLFVKEDSALNFERSFGELAGLVRRSEGLATLQVAVGQDEPKLDLALNVGQGATRVKHLKVDLSTVEVPLRESWLYATAYAYTGTREGAAEAERTAEAERGQRLLELWLELQDAFGGTALAELTRDRYYLPAPRSGMAQGHRVIASILVRESTRAGIRPMEIPTLSGVVADFISTLLTIEPSGKRGRDNALADVVHFLEREVVKGSIDVEPVAKLTYPEIFYAPHAGQPKMGRFPLSRVSSMVSELAPVVLFLKHLVKPGDMVILEEPESHLHPASQRQMARGLVRLANAGVQVLITTHSDYMTGELNNLIKLNEASDSYVREHGYSVEDRLKPEDVGAYFFRPKEGGSVVEKLAIEPDWGISEEEFAKVTEALYEETIALQRLRRRRSG